MKGILPFCLTTLAFHIALFHVSNALPRIQPPFPGPQASFDSPASAPSPIPSAKSPEPAPSPMSSAESPGPASPPPEGVFDITQYGAIADGKTENSKAFLATWEAACRNAGNSTFYIPEGTYIVGPISFSGPCYKNQSPEVKIEGTLVAPSSLNSFLNSEWIEYKNLNGLVLTGRTRVTNFDGQGAVEAWKQISCWSSRECKVLITSLKFSNVSYGTLTNISMPSLVKLSNISVKNVSGTYNTNSAVTLLCSSNVPCENIKIIDVNLNNTVSNGSTPRQGRLNLKGVINGFQVDNSRF
ncbi:Exopolygalacturonase precursor, putative [Ricinus communis]|uniref:Exopolygalacturonase, putative n=1 Tax=Ricinus communis TaxID=3988 RepID=B9RT99_RICCO|nr:Exopolygalacturonase precursor, putative [Ricinus communis]